MSERFTPDDRENAEKYKNILGNGASLGETIVNSEIDLSESPREIDAEKEIQAHYNPPQATKLTQEQVEDIMALLDEFEQESTGQDNK